MDAPEYRRLVTLLLETNAQYQLSRLETRLKKLDLQLGYLALDENGAKLLFSLFAGRYERKSLIVTTNLPFEQWQTIFKDVAMTAALVDRLTHHCHLLEMNKLQGRVARATAAISSKFSDEGMVFQHGRV